MPHSDLPDGSHPPALIAQPDAHGQAALLLAESLIHVLVDDGTLTNAQAIETVETAAEVKVEVASAAGAGRVPSGGVAEGWPSEIFG